MTIFLSALPLLVVIILMTVLRWNGQRAGWAGWLVGLLLGIFFFGLTPQVFLISQLKGLYLSFFVLLILFPALALYYLVDSVGGIRAVTGWLEARVADRGFLLVGLAWAFSGMMEGLAGFGLPVAIVAPMLTALGVPALAAVASVAVGHGWSVTFGDMGVIFQTLMNLTHLDSAALAAPAAVLLGAAILLTGIASAHLLGQMRLTLKILMVGGIMAAVQYLMAVAGLTTLAGFGAGLSGMAAILLLSPRKAPPAESRSPALRLALISYGGAILFLALVMIIPPLQTAFGNVKIGFDYPAVLTRTGFETAAAVQMFKPLLHPGTTILAAALLSYAGYRRAGAVPDGAWRTILARTWKAGAPSAVGIVAMVGLSALMDHTGMTFTLAQALAGAAGSAFPLFSPWVGILGAFATGSNNNSNVLFATLQQSVALLLALDPRILLAAQTAGGSLGSMIAPAKIMVGCNTIEKPELQGTVLRKTFPYGLGIGFLIGLFALVWTLIG